MYFHFSQEFAAEILAYENRIEAIKHFRRALTAKAGFTSDLRLCRDIVDTLRNEDHVPWFNPSTGETTILIKVEK